MVVPFIPIVPHTRTTVVNKTIVYSDTVLSLKDVGANLKVCSISNVSENSLEECLKCIFESNPDVIFNTIQYSKNDKKVYFYTDKEINKKAWEDKNVIIYRPLENSQEILEEIKDVLSQNRNKSISQISLYDLRNIIRSRYSKYKNIISNYQNKLSSIVENKLGRSSSIIIYSFDHKEGKLNIGFKYSDQYKKITFAQKEDGDVYVLKSETYHAEEILSLCSNQLLNLFKEVKSFDGFELEHNYDCKIENSNFRAAISKYGVDIFSDGLLNNRFKISSYSYKNEYEDKCNSSIVLSAVKDKEDLLYKKLFVEIENCPSWSRGVLMLLREEQLVEEEIREEEQRRTEEIRKERELKKQRRRNTLRKIFPFLK